MSPEQLPQVSIVVPLYNEHESFPELNQRLDAVLSSAPQQIEVVLVNDGSTDNTAELMRVQSLRDARYTSVFLSRNFGHQLALSAGLAEARATQAVFCIDGDLQDPPELLQDFYKLFTEGYDVVYGVRRTRDEGFFKKFFAKIYYRLQKGMSHTKVNVDSGDFALLSRRIVDILNAMPEESRYLRGLRSWVGFKQTGLAYDRPARLAGETKYNYRQMFQLAYNGIFSFSELPIKFITQIGLITICIAIAYFVYTLYKKFWLGIPVVEGFTGLLFTIILFSGVQLVSLGVIGEYVLRIFFQSKNRPLYIVKERIVSGKPSGNAEN